MSNSNRDIWIIITDDWEMRENGSGVVLDFRKTSTKTNGHL